MRNRLSRSLVLLAFAGLVRDAHAQGDKGSLTEEFKGMSAKERSRIASKEAEESLKDEAYQGLMRDAERSFQEGRYEEALTGYEKARAMRPYNVFPKVKIEDIKALIAKKNPPLEEPPPEPMPVPEPVAPSQPAVEPTRVEPAPQEVVPSPATSVAPPEEPVSTPTYTAPPPPLKKADQQIERRYKEGHAFVIERVVSVDGRVVVYKRVFHQWGQVFYFEDGVAVDERVWKARFP